MHTDRVIHSETVTETTISTVTPPSGGKIVAYILAILGCFLIMGQMTRLMVHRTAATGDVKKNDDRWRVIREFRAGNEDALNSYAWQDQSKGVVRLRIERAMELTVQEWKNPQQARALLIEKIDKATAAPPKPAYE